MSEALSSRPSPRMGMNGSSDGSSRAAIAAARGRGSRSAAMSRSSSGPVWGISGRGALGVHEQVVQRARLEYLALLGARGAQDRGVDAGQRVSDGVALGAVHQG